ncbi:phage-related integrase [Cupriavidus sp. TA19]|uniref:tyrosine-type recombinase/integrase n=1 Tax=Cupriavidus sp. TA19 TaxID=701108 RepID=UPI0027294778|nr:site-specific integrase [Cupriavidus sp. TA19]GLC93996.1 phage-related integrase [Cupriavidus sp. TA19]
MTREAPNLKSKNGRAGLPARREPYWQRVREGVYLGYRVAANGGAGTWIARRRDEGGRQQYRALGHHDEFDAAQDACVAWAVGVDHGASHKSSTVKDVCEHYAKHLEMQKGKKAAADARGRFKRLVNDQAIGRIALDKLKATVVRKWLHEQIDAAEDADELRRAKDSANRNLASLKAALNFALKDRLVATDSGWKTISKFERVGRRREAVMTPTHIASLLGHLPVDLRPLVEALAHVPSRPGELGALRVRDFDKGQSTLALEGKTGRRIVPLSTAARSFFEAQCKDKIAGALMFAQQHGAAWTKDAWKKPFREAAEAAGLPDTVVLYSLRHTMITNLVASGIDSVLIARLAGTSVEMISRHYEHADDGRVRAMLDAVPALIAST